MLQNLKTNFASSVEKQSVKVSELMKTIYEIEDMLKQDKAVFEVLKVSLTFKWILFFFLLRNILKLHTSEHLYRLVFFLNALEILF